MFMVLALHHDRAGIAVGSAGFMVSGVASLDRAPCRVAELLAAFDAEEVLFVFQPVKSQARLTIENAVRLTADDRGLPVRVLSRAHVRQAFTGDPRSTCAQMLGEAAAREMRVQHIAEIEAIAGLHAALVEAVAEAA